ncbi:MAG: beta-propeller fold lactonase family protein, partial [Verrucomicrobiales bacterium]|nr:beta-propeller fold lactonase family protein [Verrucomicrobiales bacterium]
MNTSRWLGTVLGLGVGLVSGCSTSPIDRAPREPANAAAAAWPGMRRDGRVQLPNQWLLDPVGRQVKLGDFPVNIAVHPGSRFAAVLHSGYGTHEVVIVEVMRGRVVARVELDESFYGVAFNADGSRLYVSGAGTEMVMEFAFRDGFLQEERRWALRTEQERGIPSGLAVTPDGRRLWVANLLGQSVSELDLERPGSKPGEVILGAAGTPGKTDGEDAWKDVDDEAITKRARALLETLNREAPYPYACAIDAARGRVYVSFWGQASVGVIDLATRRPLARWVTEEHPNEMLLTASGRYLYVANANRNTVSVLDTETGRTVETLTAELTPGAPPGSTPNSLALTPDESLLFVANANINALAVFDVREVGKSKPLGFIPTGWYPTSVRVTPDGRRLLVANGKGVGSRANRNGPQPGLAAPATLTEYIGGLFQGTLAILDLSSREKFEEQLVGYTARANACQPAKPPLVLEPGHPVPLRRGQASPIKYCLYIVKENRTYDQVLGDLPQGNGDP